MKNHINTVTISLDEYNELKAFKDNIMNGKKLVIYRDGYQRDIEIHYYDIEQIENNINSYKTELENIYEGYRKRFAKTKEEIINTTKTKATCFKNFLEELSA